MDSFRSLDASGRVPSGAELVVGAETVGGDELSVRAHRLAGLLRASGVDPGAVVGWLADEVLDVLVGRLAVHLLGATFLGVEASAPAEARRAAIEHVGDGVLVVEPALRADVARARSDRLAGRVLTSVGAGLEDPTAAAAREEPGAALPAPGIGAGQVAVLRMRRRDGGGFAPVGRTRREMEEQVREWADRIGDGPVRHLVLLPLHGLGGDVALGTLLAGGAVHFGVAGDRPARILAGLERVRATDMSLSLEMLSAISKEPAAQITDLSGLRRVLHVGVLPEPHEARTVFGPIFVRMADPDGAGADTMEPHHVDRALAVADEVVADITPERVRAFARRCRRAVLTSMLWALQRCGALTDPRHAASVEEILTVAGVAPRHRRLVARWVHLLAAHGRIAEAGGFVGADVVARETLTREWDEVATAWTGRLGSSTFVDYLRRNVEALPALMADEQQAALLLFPDGRTELAEAIYRETATARYLNAALAAVAAEIATHRSPSRPLRLLEVGAGTGATTEAVTAALLATGRGGLDYVCTDVSSFFLEPATRRPQQAPWMRHGVLDVDQDLRGQGHRPGSVDVVIAAGVLNNARDTDRTVRRLAELLTPGGWLLITEPTREHDEMLISQAFMMTTPDDERRHTGATFLSREQWLAVLARAGARCLRTAPPESHPLAGLGQRLFVARV